MRYAHVLSARCAKAATAFVEAIVDNTNVKNSNQKQDQQR
jgi:hypothetical protein